MPFPLRARERRTGRKQVWFPTSPLKAIRARAPRATVTYDPGTDPATAAAAAKNADVAIVFAYQWESEGMDLPSLSLSLRQDESHRHR
jgi:beta-glucosidase